MEEIFYSAIKEQSKYLKERLMLHLYEEYDE
jgi:hypothetical protein